MGCNDSRNLNSPCNIPSTQTRNLSFSIWMVRRNFLLGVNALPFVISSWPQAPFIQVFRINECECKLVSEKMTCCFNCYFGISTELTESLIQMYWYQGVGPILGAILEIYVETMRQQFHLSVYLDLPSWLKPFRQMPYERIWLRKNISYVCRILVHSILCNLQIQGYVLLNQLKSKFNSHSTEFQVSGIHLRQIYNKKEQKQIGILEKVSHTSSMLWKVRF